MSRICDFCWSTSGQPTPAVTYIALGAVGDPNEVYDACQTCAERVKEMLHTKPERRKPGRPPATAEKT
jgi:hypothetical protein